ncbi:hypothetical protein [Kitasatospora sp. NPDC048407]|uniref:hypothetical protein n=1 Tax=Kitasatospora sp. NPDC048407 TaxID=3364051 RepID=UPI00371B4C49
MNTRPPIVCAALWQDVTDRAGMRCQCTGTCGSKHTAGNGRCEREHGGWASKHSGILRLLVAPTDPADMLLPPHRASALPVEQLSAWCPTCHDRTRTAARRTARSRPAQADALFDL